MTSLNRSVLPLVLLLVLALAPFSAPLHGQSVPSAQPAVEAPKDLAGFKALETQIKAVVAKVLPAVVGIQVGNASGSGVIVREDGIVMTAGHVVGKPGQPVTFIFADGKRAKGTTLGDFVSADAGLMKITDPGKWPTAPMGHSASLRPGAWCLAIGHPLGYRPGRPPVVRVGRIVEMSNDLIRTDCPLVGGDSGGPLLDLEGNVIGINSRIANPADVNLHVPVDIFRDNWDRLLKTESWSAAPPNRPSRSGPDVKKAFHDVIQPANQCVVRVKRDGQDAVLGTIVGPDGWILTKASEIVNDNGDPKGRITCRLRDGRELEARVVGVINPPFTPPLDLAMLKIDAVHLPVIPWKVGQTAVGDWLASAGMDDDLLALGVVSVPRRAIPPVGGVMGVQLSMNAGPAQITLVMPGSPAAAAGLKVGDIITHVNGEAAADTLALRTLVGRHKPGEFIKLAVKRGGQTLEFHVHLGKLSNQALQQQQAMNSMGVGVSGRSDDFPAVIQHDTVLRPVDCGGPVIDLSGQVVGVNIAHGGRTETYCLPTDVLIVPMYELMSGRLSPMLLKVARKAAEDKAAAEEKAAAEKAAADKKAADEKAAKEKKAADEKAAKEKKAAEDKAAAEKKAADEKAAKEKKAAEEKKSGAKPGPTPKPGEKKP